MPLNGMPWYARNATRDFVDFAALSACTDERSVLASLIRSDARYGELQSDSVALEVAKTLAEPQPYDIDSIDLTTYKGIQPPWDDWTHAKAICRHFGLRLAEQLMNEGKGDEASPSDR